MLVIRIILFLSAILIMIYPVWGIIDPSSYLNELIETFPLAKGASNSQVQKSSLILLLPNTVISIALIFIAKFISSPSSYSFAKIAAITLIFFPISQSIGDVFIGSMLSQHVSGSSVALELSSQKLFYCLFGLAIWAVGKSQCEYNKQVRLRNIIKTPMNK